MKLHVKKILKLLLTTTFITGVINPLVACTDKKSNIEKLSNEIKLTLENDKTLLYANADVRQVKAKIKKYFIIEQKYFSSQNWRIDGEILLILKDDNQEVMKLEKDKIYTFKFMIINNEDQSKKLIQDDIEITRDNVEWPTEEELSNLDFTNKINFNQVQYYQYDEKPYFQEDVWGIDVENKLRCQVIFKWFNVDFKVKDKENLKAEIDKANGHDLKYNFLYNRLESNLYDLKVAYKIIKPINLSKIKMIPVPNSNVFWILGKIDTANEVTIQQIKDTIMTDILLLINDQGLIKANDINIIFYDVANNEEYTLTDKLDLTTQKSIYLQIEGKNPNRVVNSSKKIKLDLPIIKKINFIEVNPVIFPPLPIITTSNLERIPINEIKNSLDDVIDNSLKKIVAKIDKSVDYEYKLYKTDSEDSVINDNDTYDLSEEKIIYLKIIAKANSKKVINETTIKKILLPKAIKK